MLQNEPFVDVYSCSTDQPNSSDQRWTTSSRRVDRSRPGGSGRSGPGTGRHRPAAGRIVHRVTSAIGPSQMTSVTSSTGSAEVVPIEVPETAEWPDPVVDVLGPRQLEAPVHVAGPPGRVLERHNPIPGPLRNGPNNDRAQPTATFEHRSSRGCGGFGDRGQVLDRGRIRVRPRPTEPPKQPGIADVLGLHVSAFSTRASPAPASSPSAPKLSRDLGTRWSWALPVFGNPFVCVP